MKKSRFILLLLFLFLLLAEVGRAQTVGNTVAITGVTNVPLLIGTTPQTNFFGNTLPPKAISVSNIANTNAGFSYTYLLSLPGYTNGGYTNLYPLGGFTNFFYAGTNGGSWTTNYGGGYTNISFPMILQINTFTNTLNFYVP